MSISIGQILALAAAAMAAIISGMGSSKGVGMAGETAAGVSSENPDVSSKLSRSGRESPIWWPVCPLRLSAIIPPSVRPRLPWPAC